MRKIKIASCIILSIVVIVSLFIGIYIHKASKNSSTYFKEHWGIDLNTDITLKKVLYEKDQGLNGDGFRHYEVHDKSNVFSKYIFTDTLSDSDIDDISKGIKSIAKDNEVNLNPLDYTSGKFQLCILHNGMDDLYIFKLNNKGDYILLESIM